MNKAAIFDFTVEKESSAITVKRSFNAPLDPVWAAWTEADILCKWWAPKPYECVIKSLDFREGGRWFYCMQGPTGERHFGYFDYEEVRPKKYFAAISNFSDEHGNANPAIKGRHWKISFDPHAGGTLVTVRILVDSVETLEKIMQMGWKEGFTMGLDQLDELLAADNI
ncbi:MAG: SRPBCC domain-containing protein [Flavobacteriales bacterium]